MDATTLIFLILGLIALGLIVYYTVICIQVERPLSNKTPCHPDMGPLLTYEDYNGNHEEPMSERSGRVIDEPDTSGPKPEDLEEGAYGKDSNLEMPLKTVTLQMTPECASTNPSNDRSVVLPIDDDEPALLDGSKSVLPAPHERPLTSILSSGKVCQKPIQYSNDPQNMSAPVMISETPQKAMSVSFEEDGLLIPGTSSVAAQQQPHKELGRQISAPEGTVQHHPAFVQGNPRQARTVNPYYGIPHIVVDPGTYGSNRERQYFRPILKSQSSDPGGEKQSTGFVLDSYEYSPAKVKRTDSKDVYSEIKDETDINGSDQTMPCSNEGESETNPPLGWILPRFDTKENKKLWDSNFTTQNVDQLPTCPLASDEEDIYVQLPTFTRAVPCQSSPVEQNCNTDEVSVVVHISLPKEEEEVKKEEVPPEECLKDPHEDDSESSDPDITEYSFERGTRTPDAAVETVLLNEVSCYPDKIDLTNYVHLPEGSVHPGTLTPRDIGRQIIGHPPTPTSDTTKSISPISSNDNSLDEINPPVFSPNVLGTPPTTPPPSEDSSQTTIIQNNLTAELPSFIEIEPHKSSSRRSSTGSVSSSLSSSSTSTSNGSYKIDADVDDKIADLEQTDVKRGTPLQFLNNRGKQS